MSGGLRMVGVEVLFYVKAPYLHSCKDGSS